MTREANRTRSFKARIGYPVGRDGRTEAGRIDRSKWPLLARHPWIGYGPALLALLGLVWLTWSVVLTQGGKAPAWDAALGDRIYIWAKTQPQPVVLFMRFWSAVGRDLVALAGLILAGAWMRQKARRLLWMLIFGFLALSCGFK
jgi:hypothetical protein